MNQKGIGMTDQEVLQDMVKYLREDECLKCESWQSLIYWSKGVGVALRRHKFYEEHLRIKKKSSLVDFHIYLPRVSDSLCVFNNVVAKLPELEKTLKKKCPGIRVTYKTKPAGGVNAQKHKKAMVLAHFLIPAGRKDMLRDAYIEVTTALKKIDKGEEVSPRIKGDEEQVVTIEEINKFAKNCKSIENKLSTQFSIFDVLKIARMEIRHSNMLAWILDPNENHGFGGKVLQGMLERVKITHKAEELRTFSVYREQDDIDILFVSDKLNEIIAIENKIGAKEGVRRTNMTDDVESQLATYEDVLARKYPLHKKVLLFLTPDCAPPSKDTWNAISYKTLLEVVEKTYKEVYSGHDLENNSNKAILIQDYIKTIKKDVLMEANKDLVELCRKVYNENKAAVKAVLEYGVTNVGEVVEKKLKELSEGDKEVTHVGGKNFRLSCLDEIFKDVQGKTCWWGDGAYCCWIEVDLSSNKSRVCCSAGIVNDKDVYKAISKFYDMNTKNLDKKTTWVALPWNVKRGKTNTKNWKTFDESDTEQIGKKVEEAVLDLKQAIEVLKKAKKVL